MYTVIYIKFKVKRLSGNERKQTGKNLMIYGNKDVRNKNIILNRDNISKSFLVIKIIK